VIAYDLFIFKKLIVFSFPFYRFMKSACVVQSGLEAATKWILIDRLLV